MEQPERKYHILATTLAALGGLVATAIFASYMFNQSSLRDTSTTNIMAGLGALTAIYYASLHQFLKRQFLPWSTLAIVTLSLGNLILLMVQTGGIDSPYYSIWLLAIVVSGIMGGTYTIAALGVTVVYYLIAIIEHKFSFAYTSGHLIQFLITIAAAGVAEWIYSQSRRSNLHQLHAATLSGQLNQEQLKAEVLMGSMADGVVVVDNALRLQLLNPAAQTLTGWDLASAQSVNYRTVMHLKNSEDKDVDDSDDPITEAWQTGKPIIKNSLSMLTKAGRKVELSLSISPLYDQNHQVSGAIVVFHDISSEKAVERQRGEFISTASHEMRTPVAAIEGYISLAMNPKVATIDDRARSFLEKAHDSVQHLGELFRDLLSITKLEEGKVGKKLEIVDLGKLVKDVVADMQFTVTKKGLSLNYASSTGAENPAHAITPYYPVMAEPERIREVIMNLIENAMKFTSVGGITVRTTGDTASVTIGVTDTGIGIAAEDIPHLFQKFYRIDSSATRTIGGTGLGLYLCRGLIELYNGRLWVESTVGQGSTFKFSLPLAKGAEMPLAAPSSTEATDPVTPTPAPVTPQSGSTISNPFPLSTPPNAQAFTAPASLATPQAAPTIAAATSPPTAPPLSPNAATTRIPQ